METKKNILFTICGRAGSKGIKNKNLKEFLGIPLPFYTISAIDLYRKENPDVRCDVVLNTDSKELIELFSRRVNLDFDVIERDVTLAGDDIPKVAVILDCLLKMQERKKVEYIMVVDLDITSPLRTVQDVSNIIEKRKYSDSEVVFSVTESRRNPYFNMVKKTANGYERVIKSNFNARQEAPLIFDMNASIYAYTPLFLKNEKGIFEAKCDAIKMMDTAVLDLDHENDIELMQVIAEYLFEKYSPFRCIKENIEKCCNA